MAPLDATEESHKMERDRCKAIVLGVQYDMSPFGLAASLNCPIELARQLHRRHQETYPKLWDWLDTQIDRSMLYNVNETCFGWRLNTGESPNPRSPQNFPVQGTGNEVLRLACSMLTEAGIRVCMPVHDAVLIEAPIDRIETDTACTQDLMVEASKIVLDGFPVRVGSEPVCHPDR